MKTKTKIIPINELRLCTSIFLDFTINIVLTIAIFLVMFFGSKFMLWIISYFGNGQNAQWMLYSTITDAISLGLSLLVLVILSIRSFKKYRRLLDEE
ncbi:MAG: hypothetical protein WC867_00330 [Candidatus Pacearchaeota archaeon]|jgi:hypothetical protein